MNFGLFFSERLEKDSLEATMWLEPPEFIMYAEDGEKTFNHFIIVELLQIFEIRWPNLVGVVIMRQ